MTALKVSRVSRSRIIPEITTTEARKELARRVKPSLCDIRRMPISADGFTRIPIWLSLLRRFRPIALTRCCPLGGVRGQHRCGIPGYSSTVRDRWGGFPLSTAERGDSAVVNDRIAELALSINERHPDWVNSLFRVRCRAKAPSRGALRNYCGPIALLARDYFRQLIEDRCSPGYLGLELLMRPLSMGFPDHAGGGSGCSVAG